MDETDRPDDQSEPPTLAQLASALAKDAALLVEAEGAYWRNVLAFALRRAKTIALLAVLAVFFAFFALMALVVGLLLALAPVIGAWGAMGAVTLGLALVALASVGLARRRVRRMIALLVGERR